LAKASEGHGDKLEEAAEEAREAKRKLAAQEDALSQLTEDVARLAARHQSAQRLLEDNRKTLEKSEAEAARARAAVDEAKAALENSRTAFATAEEAQNQANAQAEAAEAALVAADEARGQAQGREADARAERSEAEGEVNALRAEVMALAKLLERDTSEGGQILDVLRVTPGYEKALGAALADDLRAPAVDDDAPSGWVALPGYSQPQTLPDGVVALSNHVTVPEVLARRMAQVGLVEPEDGPRLQAALKPGQRLVSLEGDLWRWDGFRAGAEDAPSTAALRLEQLNRLEELKQALEHASARADGAMRAHEALREESSRANDADKSASDARREGDRAAAEASRALSRAEADQNIASGKLENLGMAVTRHEEEALAASTRLREAEKAASELADLDTARAEVEDVKLTVEAARMTMLAKRSAHDELKREGEARVKRAQQVTKEISGWRHRLDSAGKRIAELGERKLTSEADLKEASAAPAELAAKREELSKAIADAEARRATAMDVLTGAEGALREAMGQERDGERLAGEAREARARGEARADAARETVAYAAERIEEEQECSPADLLESLGADPDQMPGSEQIEHDVNRLKRQRDALGAVYL
ncbi:MAG: hypothetical protein P8X85_25455, partial [Desulfobacterales bacterium]